ncbi:MAG: FKBP-type peptidyl-prolyl cis-trans isomerase [Thermoplasmata archaeon]|nr:FKBP-type peptidyl-prolyl cis-trans isomerase [Thermoplasmata archaeon]
MTLEENRYLIYELAIGIIVVLLIAAWMNPPAEERAKEKKATMGDALYVWYVGYFDDGSVFDTNREEVDADDDMWPKSPGYQHPEDDSRWEPLEFVLGSGSLLEDFETACIDLKQGDTTTFTIIPERGYGLTDEDLLVTVDLVQEFPVYERVPMDRFNETYGPNYDPAEGAPPINLTFGHFNFGWNVTVISISEDFIVTLFNDPRIGEIDTFPWPVAVQDVDGGADGNITIEHFPSVGDTTKGEFAAKDPWGAGLPSKKSFGIVVDVGTEKFTLDYNREVVGKTLHFDVEVVLIKR